MAFAYGPIMTRSLLPARRPVRSPALPARPRRAQPIPKLPAMNADEIIAAYRHRRRTLARLAPSAKRRSRERLSVVEYALGSQAQRDRHNGWLHDFMRRTASPMPRDRAAGRGWVR
jgi:hypothetical protein